METKYNVFTRTWWKNNPNWPNGLEPHMGRKTYLRRNVTREQAREICEAYNSTHKPGRYSRKAEFQSV